MAPRILLASQSPRRRQLLEQIGIQFAVIEVDIVEQRQAEESPEQFVVRMAMEKAQAGKSAAKSAGPGLVGLPALGADTIVVVEQQVLGKPENRKAALATLASLSGRTHQVLSAVALAADTVTHRLSRSLVKFRTLSAAERTAYWATGEPTDKAGAYAIQGRAAVFVENLQGSYSGVVGLPLFETAALLANAGIFPFGEVESNRDE